MSPGLSPRLSSGLSPGLSTTFPGFSFSVVRRVTGDPQWPGRARLGRLETPHGALETPAFVFCATKAAIKAAAPDRMWAAGSRIVLGNTLHLMLQPGTAAVARHGGLHRMMGWQGPMLTDSGGFQIFSLGHGSVAEEIKGRRTGGRSPSLLGIDETGARFRSWLDGRVHELTPENAIAAQRELGADIVLVLDECTPYHVDRDYTARAMARSHRWATRSVAAFARDAAGSAGPQALYGIVQGGVYADLRRESTGFVRDLPVFGYAVGGCLGGSAAQMQEVVGMAAAGLDDGRPVHLLGIGRPADIWQAVAKGVDTFDCVAPTRLARHGGALLRAGIAGRRGHINLRNAAFRDDHGPLDPGCPCYCCTTFTRAYLNHLVRAGEILAMQLLTLHNVTFMNRLMATIRAAIAADRFAAAHRAWFA